MKKLSIVIPMYNESKVIRHNIEDILLPFLSKKSFPYEVILVNDGSKDNTLEIIQSIKGVKVVTYPDNGGKGKAIRAGFKAVTGDYVLFMDADLCFDLSCIDRFVKEIDDGYDMHIASRALKDSEIINKPALKRRIMSKCCNIYISFLFHFKIKDTQCGFKLYKTELAKLIAEKSMVNGFSFDVEHLYIAKLNGYKVKELPVKLTNNLDSKVSPIKSSLTFITSAVKIRKHKHDYYK